MVLASARKRVGKGVVCRADNPSLQNHSFLLKMKMHLPHGREALPSLYWNRESSDHQRQLRKPGRRAFKKQQATGNLKDGSDLGTKMVKFQLRTSRKSKFLPFYFSFLNHLCVRHPPRVSSESRACACILLALLFLVEIRDCLLSRTYEFTNMNDLLIYLA